MRHMASTHKLTRMGFSAQGGRGGTVTWYERDTEDGRRHGRESGCSLTMRTSRARQLWISCWRSPESRWRYARYERSVKQKMKRGYYRVWTFFSFSMDSRCAYGTTCRINSWYRTITRRTWLSLDRRDVNMYDILLNSRCWLGTPCTRLLMLVFIEGNKSKVYFNFFWRVCTFEGPQVENLL